MSKFMKRVALVTTSLMVAWPIVDGCWRGFLGSPDWRMDALFHSMAVSLTAGLCFVLPGLIQHLKPAPR